MINLVKAAFAETAETAAIYYGVAGVSIIPLNGKIATVDWAVFQTRLPEFYQLKQWFGVKYPPNLGVICGAVSGNLVVIDLDGVEAINRFNYRFPHLMKTYNVLTGSGKGLHLYYYVKELPATTRYIGTKGNVEVRSDGCYVVAPPHSKHPVTGRLYKPSYDMVAEINDVGEVVDWINKLNSQKPFLANHKVSDSGGNTPLGAKNPRWVKAAVDAELDNVLRAEQGARNQTLFFAALRLGQLCANPNSELNRHQICEQLFNVALRSGYVADDGARQAINTIASGMNRGLTEPRPIPQPRGGA